MKATTQRRNIAKKKLLIGAHVSVAGGLENGPINGEKIKANAIQIFTSNQRQWKGKEISEEAREKWHTALKKHSIEIVMSHDSYLINLGSTNKELLDKSREAFREEIGRCKALNIPLLNFHPGAYTSSSEQECLDRIVESLNSFKEELAEAQVRLLLETTAGQGTSVGHLFEHLAYIIEKTSPEIPLGVCIDTCHIFAAGYDIRTKETFEETLKKFDAVVGLSHLYALHLNDSKKPFASKRDRHEMLGKGEIGLEAFRLIMHHPKLSSLPLFLETPDPLHYEEELNLLREFAYETDQN